MNGKELLQSMSEIENDLIIQSEFEFHQKKKIIHVKRRIAIAACLCLCLCGTVPILAFAGNDFAHELLYSISPSIAQKLKPINVSCEDNGIEMTVVAAEVNGEKTTILLSMHDKIAKRQLIFLIVIVFALRMIKVEDVLLLVMMLVRIRQHSC